MYLIRLLFIVICCYCCCLTENLNEEDTKFFNYLTTRKVKPTSAIVHHEPGVPPGWPSRKTTTVKPKGLIKFTSNLTRNNATSRPEEGQIGSNEPPNKGFVDWILNTIGFTTSPKPTDIISPKDCPKCECGIASKHNRIVGGVETQVNGYPWMTALMYNGRFYCGASVISNKYLLTAAHCVSSFPKEKLSATFLEHDRSIRNETKSFTKKIIQIIRHNSYGTGGNYNNDVALLKIEGELKFDNVLRPVCMPQHGAHYAGQKGIAIGWGATQEAGQTSDKLLEVEVPIMANSACRKTGYGNKITSNMLCAGYLEGMKDSCQGDSGGPLHVINNTHHEVVGIVSWGEGCAAANYPGVYTRVNRYISWIRINTQDSCFC